MFQPEKPNKLSHQINLTNQIDQRSEINETNGMNQIGTVPGWEAKTGFREGIEKTYKWF